MSHGHHGLESFKAIRQSCSSEGAEVSLVGHVSRARYAPPARPTAVLSPFSRCLQLMHAIHAGNWLRQRIAAFPHSRHEALLSCTPVEGAHNHGDLLHKRLLQSLHSAICSRSQRNAAANPLNEHAQQVVISQADSVVVSGSMWRCVYWPLWADMRNEVQLVI